MTVTCRVVPRRRGYEAPYAARWLHHARGGPGARQYLSFRCEVQAPKQSCTPCTWM